MADDITPAADQSASAIPTDTPVTPPEGAVTEQPAVDDDKDFNDAFAEATSTKPPVKKDKPIEPAAPAPDAETEKPVDTPEVPPEKPAEVPPEKPAPPVPTNQEAFSAPKFIENIMADFPLPEIDMGDGMKLSMKELRETYPDIISGTTLMASHISNQNIDRALASGELVSGEKFKALESIVKEMQGGLMKEKFAGALNKDFEGADKIRESSEFQAWLGKQPAKVAELNKSSEVKDVVYLLKQYEHSTKLSREKKKMIDLNSGTLRNSNRQDSKTINAEEEFSNAFDEAIKKV